MDKRVAVFIAPGLEEIEGLTVVDILYRANIPCDTVAITESTLVTSSHGVRIVCDRSIADEDFDFSAYDMLVLPGGMPGTTNLGACEPLTAALVAHAAAGKPVAAICAAPMVLAELGLVEGKRATIFPGMEEHLVRGGAEAVSDPAVVDGAVITGRGMGAAISFALAIQAYYQGEDAARDLAEKIVAHA